MNITIGAVVVVYKEQDMVPALLAALQKEVDRIVLVANAPLHVDVPKDIEVIEQENTGFGAGVNTGALLLKECTHILIINPDIRIEEGMVQALLNGMKKTRADMVQPVIRCLDDSINSTGNALTFYGISYPRDFGKTNMPKRNKSVFIVSGACLLLTQEAWKKLGGFAEPYFMYHEDTDLSWRAELYGLRKYCIADATCWHDYAVRLPHWKLAYLEQNRLLLLVQNYSWWTLILILPVLLYVELGMLCFAIWSGWGKEKMHTYLTVWKLRSWVMSKRKEVQSKRTIRDKEILKSMDGAVLLSALQSPLVQYALNPVMKLWLWGARLLPL